MNKFPYRYVFIINFVINSSPMQRIYDNGMGEITFGQMQLPTIGNIVPLRRHVRVTPSECAVMSVREVTAVETVSVARRLHGVAKDASALVVTQARGREH